MFLQRLARLHLLFAGVSPGNVHRFPVGNRQVRGIYSVGFANSCQRLFFEPQFAHMATLSFPALVRSKVVIFWLFAVSALLFFVYAPLPKDVHNYRDAAVNSAAGSVLDAWRPYSHPGGTTTEKNGPKYAYATFLAGNYNNDGEDVYFLGARLLAYQLLHAPETKSNNSIPFLVVATQAVSEAKKERLRQDGAEVVVVDDLIAEWIGDPRNNPRFKDVMTKLRVWEMTQYDRLCLIDGDTVLMGNIDGVFDDPAVKTRTTLNKPGAIKDDEAPQPIEYAIASTAEPSRSFLSPDKFVKAIIASY